MFLIDKICKSIGLDAIDNMNPFKEMQGKIKIKVSNLIFGILIILILLLIFDIGNYLICSMLGFIYPAYMSFRAIELPIKNDDKLWLAYWVIYAIVTVYDPIIMFPLKIIPGSYILKLIFFIYLFHPKTRGAIRIYDKFFDPFIKNYESKIDENLAIMEKEVTEIYNKTK